MHHYTDSGLSYVYLENGYNVEHIDGEEFISIDNLDQLHQLLGKNILSMTRPLQGEEFRFIRIELNMSQRVLANLLGVDSQTIARWEKDQTLIPRTADVALRALYMEANSEESQIGLLLNMLSGSEIETVMQELHLKETNNIWQLSVA